MSEKNNSGNKQPKDIVKDSSVYVINTTETYMSQTEDKAKNESSTVSDNEREYANALLAAIGSFNKKILTPKSHPQANAQVAREASKETSAFAPKSSASLTPIVNSKQTNINANSPTEKENSEEVANNLKENTQTTETAKAKTANTSKEDKVKEKILLEAKTEKKTESKSENKKQTNSPEISEPEITLDLNTLASKDGDSKEETAKEEDSASSKTSSSVKTTSPIPTMTTNNSVKNKNSNPDLASVFYAEKIEKHGAKSSKANKAEGEEKTESGRILVSKLTQQELSHTQEKDFEDLVIPEFSFEVEENSLENSFENRDENGEENIVKTDGYSYPKIHFDDISNTPTSNQFNADGTTYDEITLLSPESEITLDPDLDKSFPKDDRFSGDNLQPKEGPLSAYFEADNSASFKKILDNYNPNDKRVKFSSATTKITPQKASLIAGNRQAAKKFANPEATKEASKNANLEQQGRKVEEASSNEVYESIQEPAKTFSSNPESFYDTSNNKGLEQDISLREIAQVASQNREVYLEANDEEANFELIRLERKRRKAHIRSYRRSPTLFVLRQVIKPLSLINPFLSVILGAAISLPAIPGDLDKNILIASLLTVFFVQIFANLCREYSTEELSSRFECSLVDHKFTTRKTIYRYTIVAFILSCISGATLIYFADLNVGTTLVFAGLGIITITMLLRYSVGENPYSFSIFGEFSYLFVYGLLMVGSSFFLQVHRYENIIIVPALACGLCAVASLNLINMRDSYVSAVYEKDNFATFLGPKAGRLLQTLLYFGAVVLYTYFNYVLQFPAYCYAFLISVPLIIYHLIIVHQDVKSSTLNLQKYVTTAINVTMTGGFALTLWLFLSR